MYRMTTVASLLLTRHNPIVHLVILGTLIFNSLSLVVSVTTNKWARPATVNRAHPVKPRLDSVSSPVKPRQRRDSFGRTLIVQSSNIFAATVSTKNRHRGPLLALFRDVIIQPFKLMSPTARRPRVTPVKYFYVSVKYLYVPVKYFDAPVKKLCAQSKCTVPCTWNMWNQPVK